MADFNIRADSVNVEQIMEQIRARIRDLDGVLDVRLERLEAGVAWYRINQAADTDLGGAVAAALAPLGLAVMATRAHL